MNSVFTVHNSKICLLKSTNVGQKKKKGENVNWRKRKRKNAQPKHPLKLDSSQNIKLRAHWFRFSVLAHDDLLAWEFVHQDFQIY